MEPIAFGKYLLTEQIAEGGMAVVYRAKLTGPGGFEKTLVVKQIRAELAANPDFIDLFVKEAKTTVQLTHANIVPVFELGMVDGTYFLALELVDGPPLAKLIDRGAFPAPLAAYVGEQILRGLDHAHRRDIVHRDLSPANVMCSRDGEVKLLDFGISAEVSGRAIVGGSRGYIAPEQEAGARVDARSDLFAVGVLIWEMLAGKRREPGVPKGTPDALAVVVERALAERPEDRWPSAEAMLLPLTRYLRDTEGSTQAELSRLVRQRAPDVPIHSGPASDAPRTRPVRDRAVNATPALGIRTMPPPREVTFATRFLEASPITPTADVRSASASPSPSPSPSPLLSPPRSARRLLFVLGGLVLVAASALAGARLRDAVGTSGPPLVRPAELPGALRVALDPPNARLLVDGVDATTLPRSRDGKLLLSPGDHTLSATLPNRPSYDSHLVLHAGEQRSVSLTVPAEEGIVQLRSEPPGAEVHLGDRSLGLTPTSAQISLASPSRLRFERRDYVAAERVLRPEELSGGPPRTATISQTLEPLPRGQLTLGARPWAHVTIDGERRPDTPLLRLPISAGSHVVKLACPATGKELRFNVQVEAGHELRRVADLTGTNGDPHLID